MKISPSAGPSVARVCFATLGLLACTSTEPGEPLATPNPSAAGMEASTPRSPAPADREPDAAPLDIPRQETGRADQRPQDTPSEPSAAHDTDAPAAPPTDGQQAEGSTGPAQPPASPDACGGGLEADFRLIGWASVDGGTTGGQGGAVLEVQDGAALNQALKDHRDQAGGLTLLVAGEIRVENTGAEKIDVKDVKNVSIIGAATGAALNGIGIKIVRASNIVIRNLTVHNVLSGDKDAISIEGPADHIWIDHCELYAELDGVEKDDYDGLLDAKADAEYLTYSWNYLHDSWKAALIGSSDSDTHDRKVTVHHNHFYHCNSRLPLIRSSQVHVFSNYYNDVQSSAINSRVNACTRIEGNVFEDVQNPWLSAYSDTLGGVDLGCNQVDDRSSFSYDEDDADEPLTCAAELPYDYQQVLTRTDVLPELVMEHTGVGKLSDPLAF